MVTLPKDEGGLGVLNLTTQNESLLLKHLHKFYSRTQVHGFTWSGQSIMLVVSCLCQMCISELPFG